jgi:hypothetical protein
MLPCQRVSHAWVKKWPKSRPERTPLHTALCCARRCGNNTHTPARTDEKGGFPKIIMKLKTARTQPSYARAPVTAVDGGGEAKNGSQHIHLAGDRAATAADAFHRRGPPARPPGDDQITQESLQGTLRRSVGRATACTAHDKNTREETNDRTASKQRKQNNRESGRVGGLPPGDGWQEARIDAAVGFQGVGVEGGGGQALSAPARHARVVAAAHEPAPRVG